MLSGFKYQNGTGQQFTIPVAYGDISQQVASIIKSNSENTMTSAPKIAVYITDLKLDRSRLADATHVSKIHIREREKIMDSAGNVVDYGPLQGNSYTVERLMPTPYKLSAQADIWTTNTDQKLQILEQILMFFNPSIEIQTSDNYIDWTSLSVVELTDVRFDSRTIPVGTDSQLMIASLMFECPIWISPPSKVKRLGVIQNIIMNIQDESYSFETDVRVSVTGYNVLVQAIPNSPMYSVEFLDPTAAIVDIAQNYNITNVFQRYGNKANWAMIIDQYPNKFRAGYSQIFLRQSNGNEIVGVVALNQDDEGQLIVQFDQDTYPTNQPIIVNSTNQNPRATVDAIVDPLTYNPRPVLTVTPATGTRFLLLNDINGEWLEYVTEPNPAFDQNAYNADPINYTVPRVRYTRDSNGNPLTYYATNEDGSDAWAEWDISDINFPVKVNDFIAKKNDIIEWNGTRWEVVLESATVEQIIYTTNLKTGVQYKFENQQWARSFEGLYRAGEWELVL